MGEAGGPTKLMWRLQSAFLWRLDTVSFGKTKEMGSKGRTGHRPPPNVTAHTHQAPDTHQPSPKSGEDDPRPPRQKRSREWWSRRGKKSAFLWRLDTVSLGKHQRNGVERQGKATTTSQSIGAHAPSEKIKGGTPGEGSPLDPLLRLNKHKRVPRSAERGQRLCLWTPPPLKRRAKLSFALRAALSVYWTCARCAGNRRPLSARRGSLGATR